MDINLNNFKTLAERFYAKKILASNYHWWVYNEGDEVDFLSIYKYDTLSNCLLDLIPGYLDLIEDFSTNTENYKNRYDSEGIPLWSGSVEPFVEDLIYNTINKEFKLLFDFSNINNLYFSFCSFKVYENTIKERYENKRKEIFDFDFHSFLLDEYNSIYDSNRTLYLDDKNSKHFRISFLKKLDFIESELYKLGYNIKEINKQRYLPQREFKLVKNEIIQDTSIPEEETPQIITYKAIAIILNETEIINHLNVKYTLDNNLGPMMKICSILTGIKYTTIQPYLNTIIQSQKFDHRYPYNSVKAITEANEMFKSQNIDIVIPLPNTH
jgi:hypothetical protein